MTDIKIIRLTLENFKCHESITLVFNGKNTAIYGDNATGKTSIYDALTWLLFGKDSLGNGEKNIEIKPLDENGNVKDHLAVTSVEALLHVNGEPLTLRRTLQEIWKTKRGSMEATYEGNTSEYYVDGVPCKKNAFTDKVGELVSEERFKLLTSVSYFARDLSWQDRRAILFDVAGSVDEATIMRSNPMFLPLIERMGRFSAVDYKKKLLTDKRALVGAKTEIPARISECQKTIGEIEQLDFSAARRQIEALNAEKDRISSEILAMERNTAAEQKRMEIREAQLSLTALENENNAYRASQKPATIDTGELTAQVARLKHALDVKNRQVSSAQRSIEGFDRGIAQARARWIETSKETFTGGNCPTCGQVLPANLYQGALADFERKKKERLTDIEDLASSQKTARAEAEARLGEYTAELSTIGDQIQEAEQKLGALSAESPAVEIFDLDGYKEKRTAITERIEHLSLKLTALQSDSLSSLSILRAELRDVTSKIKENYAILGKESALTYARERIEDLRRDERETAKRLEDVEHQLYLVEEFTRYKTKYVESSINNMFRLAKFRLFREQANGGIEDRCDVVYDGVPYINVNNGARINLGIDIINTLSAAYGVRVPLFVDNAESVTNMEYTDTQTVRLVVSEYDKEIRLDYEG